MKIILTPEISRVKMTSSSVCVVCEQVSCKASHNTWKKKKKKSIKYCESPRDKTVLCNNINSIYTQLCYVHTNTHTHRPRIENNTHLLFAKVKLNPHVLIQIFIPLKIIKRN